MARPGYSSFTTISSMKILAISALLYCRAASRKWERRSFFQFNPFRPSLPSLSSLVSLSSPCHRRYNNRSVVTIPETSLNLELAEEQQHLQKSVRDLAEAEVKPLAKEIDETGHFPFETFKKAAELGLTGVAVPETYGGAGMDHVSYAIVIEEISRV